MGPAVASGSSPYPTWPFPALDPQPAWRPRAAVYFGTGLPVLDSIDEATCAACDGNASLKCCPPLMMTIGCGHCGTSTVTSWLLAFPNTTMSIKNKEPRWLTPAKTDIHSYLQLWPNTGVASARFGVDMSPANGGVCPTHPSTVIGAADHMARAAVRLMPMIKLLVFVRNPADLLYSISRCPTPEAYEHAVINHVTIRRALPGYGCPYSMVAPWLERYPRNRFLFFLNSRLRGREIDHLLDLLDFLGLGASAKQWVERVNLTQLVLQSNNHVSNRLPMLQSTRDYLESVLCTCYASMLRTLGQKPHRDCAALSEAQLTHINGTRVPQVTGFHCGIRMQCYASRDPMPVAPGA